MCTNEQVVNIIKRDDSNSPYLDQSKLKELLINTQASDIPVAFYSICGSARLGKSFLWNQFIRYLKDKHLFLCDLESSQYLEKFFEWKGGDERHTDGILVYKHPFILRTSNYDKIALFLMDTQGMFDEIESGKNSGTIFALSFLISSLQVYNVQSKLESTHLQYSYKAMKILESVRKCKPGTKPIQSLMFLVRDWRRKRAYALGLAGGNNYVSTQMTQKEAQAADQRDVREEIKNNFETISGFLLPEPGETIVDMLAEESNCQVKDVERIFYETAEELFRYLCKKENVVVKTVDGEVLKGRDLFTYVVEVANKIARFPAAMESFGTFIEHDYRADMRTFTFDALKSYMLNICQEFQDCLIRHNQRIKEQKEKKEQNIDDLKIDRNELQQRHEDLKNTAIQEFREVSKPGGSELHNRWEKVLGDLIEKNYKKFKECVRSEKAFANALKSYEGELRSSAQDISDGWNRIRHPKDEAKKRSSRALAQATEDINKEVQDEFIAQQCIRKLEKRASILLDQHLLRIERIIKGFAVGAITLVVGAGVGAVVAVLEVPTVMAIAGATELTTGLIVNSAVVGGVIGAATGVATYVVTNYLSPVEQVIRMSWAEGGDDLSCIEAEIGVALSYGVVRFRMETTP